MLKTMAIGAVLCWSSIAEQREDEWTWKAGVSRRSFDVELQARPIVNPAIGAGKYVNFATTGVGDISWTMMDNTVQAPGLSTNVIIDSASLMDEDENETGYGLVVSANKEWKLLDNCVLNWDVGLGYFGLDADNVTAASPGAETGFATANYTFTIATFFPPLPLTGNPLFPVSSGPNITGSGLALATISTDTEIDSEVFVFSGGLLASRAVGNWNLGLGFGPTLTIADTDSVYKQSITTGARTDSFRERKSTTDVILGLYAKLDCEYFLTEQLSLGVAARYDVAASEIKTKHAEIDLDGESVELKLTWRF